MTTRKLKMWIGNYDGSREGLVIAPTKKRAIEVVGAGHTDFDRYWTEKPIYPALEPEMLYTRPMIGIAGRRRDDAVPWHRGRCPLEKKP